MIRGLGLAWGVWLLVTLGGCKNPRYCDVTTPCEDESTPFCDVDGVVSGIRNHCTAYPGNRPDAMIRCDDPSDCGGSTPACDQTTGFCVACLDDSTCPTAEAPVCMTESRTCGGCGADVDCADRGDGRIHCYTTSGHCQACVDDGDCAVAAAPICDDATQACRACQADAECPSGVCDLDGGGCVGEADVIYVVSGGVGATCSRAEPCGTLAGAVGQLAAGRKWILVAAAVAPYVEATVSIDDRAAVIKGAGATLRAANDNTAALVVEGTSDVLIEGLTLTAPFGTTPSANADGVRCADASATPKLTLRGVVLDGSKGQGVDGNPCELSIVGSVIQRNAGGGVTAEDGNVVISRSVISENTGGGVSLEACNFDLTNNFFWDNGSAGSLYGALRLIHTGTPSPKRLELNSLVGNEATDGAAAGVLCQITTTNVAAKHNLVHDNERDGAGSQVGDFDGPNGCVWTYSLVTDVAFAGTGNLAGPNPMFLNVASGDLHLAPGSTGINAGDPAGTAVTVDIDAEPRPVGVVDLGADEVQ